MHCLEMWSLQLILQSLMLFAPVMVEMGDMAHHPGSHFTKGWQSNSAAEKYVGFFFKHLYEACNSLKALDSRPNEWTIKLFF